MADEPVVDYEGWVYTVEPAPTACICGRPFGLTDEMVERAARSLYAQGMGYDIDADPTARESMLAVARIALTAALSEERHDG